MNLRFNKSLISSLLRGKGLRGKGLFAAIAFVVLLGMLGVVGFVRPAHFAHADAPTLNIPGNQTATANTLDTYIAIAAWPAIVVTDGDPFPVVGGDLPTPVICTSTNGGVVLPTNDGGTFQLGVSTVTCTAPSGDIADDSAVVGSFTVTVNDIAPTFSGVPGTITVDSTTPAGAGATATVSYGSTITASEADAVPQSITPTCVSTGATTGAVGLSGGTFNLGTSTVTCTATDTDSPLLGGGPAVTTSATATFTVIVVESAPVFSGVPANQTATATAADTAAITYGPIAAAESEVGGGTESVTPTCVSTGVTTGAVGLSGNTFNVGVSTVTCTAADPDGLTSTATFMVTVNDPAPVLTLPTSPVVVNATSPAGATVSYGPVTAAETGEAGETINITCTANTSATSGNSFVSSGNFPIGNTTVSCTATDATDGTTPGTGSFVVHVAGAVEQLNNLCNQFPSLSFGEEGTFCQQLQGVIPSVQGGRTSQACLTLTVLIIEITQQHIPAAQATVILAALNNIQGVLNCPPNTDYDHD